MVYVGKLKAAADVFEVVVGEGVYDVPARPDGTGDGVAVAMCSGVCRGRAV